MPPVRALLIGRRAQPEVVISREDGKTNTTSEDVDRLNTAAAPFDLVLLTSLLYDIAPTDPTSFGLAATAVGIAGLTASYIPAARAARVNPLALLRAE